MLRHRTYLLLAGLLVVVSLPARFAQMNDSIWMDEAWVANSVMAPSLHEMFFTSTWTQSSPPLFLVVERLVGLRWPSEAALRVLPAAAGLAGLLLAAIVLGRRLSTNAALLGVTLLCGNYYLIKYGQQVKQYGSDFLVSAVLMVLLERYMDGRSGRRFAALLIAGTIGFFLSYTAAFWLIPLVVAEVRWGRIAGAAGLLGSAMAVVYLFFVRPNRTAALIQNFRTDNLDLTHPLAIRAFVSTIGMLLVARAGMIAIVVGICASALALIAIARAIGGSPTEWMVLLAGALPPACAMAASMLGLYPVLNYPRMLLFALPSVALLLGYGVERFIRLPIGSVALLCLATVVVSQVIFFRYPRPNEENRPAITFLKDNADASDLLYVHGGMFEQFKYYQKLLGYYPPQVYVGNSGWPCCATGDRELAADPLAQDFAGDVLEAARRRRGHRVWLLVPAASEGHWSEAFREEIQAAPAVLAGGGCQEDARRVFGQTLVEGYSCR